MMTFVGDHSGRLLRILLALLAAAALWWLLTETRNAAAYASVNGLDMSIDREFVTCVEHPRSCTSR